VSQGHPEPLAIAAAPNGARRTKADHPALPITPDELAETARRCRDAGAALLHLHVRDAEGGHSLDPRHYSQATAAVRAAVGDGLVIQATTEAAGRYAPAEQLDAMRALQPEAVSLAVREVMATDADAQATSEFLHWALDAEVAPQFILYDAQDLARFRALAARGLVPGRRHFLLFVLGRYAEQQVAAPRDLLGFLCAEGGLAQPWMLCAFGPREAACATAAVGLGGHVRVGFENNLQMPDGTQAPDNAALVSGVADAARAAGRPLADAATLRRWMAEWMRG
jgi:uncharacterized protein (DUF849 family)